MFRPSRNRVISRSRVGKTENSSGSLVYSETSRMMSAPAILTVMRPSRISSGNGMIIIASTATTTTASMMSECLSSPLEAAGALAATAIPRREGTERREWRDPERGAAGIRARERHAGLAEAQVSGHASASVHVGSVGGGRWRP